MVYRAVGSTLEPKCLYQLLQHSGGGTGMRLHGISPQDTCWGSKAMGEEGQRRESYEFVNWSQSTIIRVEWI